MGREEAARMWRSFFVISGIKEAAVQGERLRRKLARVAFVCISCSISAIAHAQYSSAGASKDGTVDPVAEVRQNRSWEYGPFVNWGTGLGNRSDFKFFWGGYELSKVLSPVVHAGILSGQFQYGGNIIPLWQAYTPPPHEEAYTCETTGGQFVSCVLPTGGGTFYGVSLTPVIFRWNLKTRSRR